MPSDRRRAMARSEEVVIIGGGPAGIAAALQLRRQGIDPLLIERERLGGLLWNAHCIENYPGLPDPLPGPELARRMSEQLRRHQVRLFGGAVSEVGVIPGATEAVTRGGAAFRVMVAGRAHRARTLVIASGTRPKMPPDLEIPAGAAGRVHTEVVTLRDLPEARVAVIGAGDAAFDYALSLSRRHEVRILGRGTPARSLPLLRRRVAAAPRITYHPDCRVRQIEWRPAGCLDLTCDGEPRRLAVDRLVFAIGREPDLEFMTPELRRSHEEWCNRGLLHFAGDVQGGIFRQAAIAAGDGIRVAMQIARHIAEGSG